jgi:hypothetical protein
VSGKKTILFELNEVPTRIVDAFCAWRPDSVLARRLPACFQYEALCEDVGPLSPWRTWPSLHRGVPNDQHGIAHFGQPLDEADRARPPLWKILAASGVRCGVFGSLHSYPMPESLEGYDFYFPDTFAAGSECFPDDLEVLQHFNLVMARRSARNVDTGVPWSEALRLLRSIPSLGIRPGTLLEAAWQVGSERVQPWRATRRRTLQPALAFDCFERQLRRTLPDFTTFFTNHVASTMHRYWAARFPEDYDADEYPPGWRETYMGEIEFTMSRADAMLARLFDFVDHHPDYQLVIATSMGQAATVAQPVLSQLYVTSLETFMARMGVPAAEWASAPAMLPEANVRVEPERVDAFRERLRALHIEDRPVRFEEEEGGFFCMSFGQENLHEGDHVARLGESAIPLAELGLEPLMIDDASGTCAYHIPEGTLFVYRPDRRPAPGAPRVQASFLDVAPWLLENFAVPVPSYMQRPAQLT